MFVDDLSNHISTTAMVQRLSSPRDETQQEVHKLGEVSDGRINLFTSGTPYSSSSNEARVQLASRRRRSSWTTW